MPIVPSRFKDFEKFFEDELFTKSLSVSPKMDIYSKGNDVVVKVEMPGLNAKDIDVEVTEGHIKIEGKSENKKEEKKKGYYKKEISQGYFQRIASLPCEVEKGKAKAEYKDGILKVVLPKSKKAKVLEKGTKVKVK